ncbi:MAG: hypothetical protein E7185_01475 [Erysipelotrichaceae bacterium]|nr:hypothetical protein [Erysipelotrichaceae bacterium]
MRGSPEERAAVKKSFERMNLKEKAAYIFAYYKLPLFTAFVVLAVAVSSLYHYITKKEEVLYLAYVNFAPGETLTGELSDEYLDFTGRDPQKTEVLIYDALYIDEDPALADHQYAYASRMKILGAINAGKMDVAIMNENAFKQMSASGLLLKMDMVLIPDPSLAEQIQPYVVEGTVIIEDNSVEYNLNEADTYEAVTEQVENAIDVSEFPVFVNAGIKDKLYIGVIGNTKHIDEVRTYLAYLLNHN